MPLNSDCFSRFGKDSPPQHQQDIIEATLKLETETIENFARDLVNREDWDFPAESEDLTEFIAELHLRGINVRYLLLLYLRIQQLHPPQQTLEAFATMCFTEMSARAAKEELFARWREIQSTDDDEYTKAATTFVRSFADDSFWDDNLTQAVQSKFLGAANRIIPLADLSIQLRRVVDRPLFVDRVAHLAGLRLSENHCQVLEIQPRVKYMHRVSFEEGTALSRMAMSKSGTFSSALIVRLGVFSPA